MFNKHLKKIRQMRISLNVVLVIVGVLFFAGAIYRALADPALNKLLSDKFAIATKAITYDNTPSMEISIEVRAMTCEGCELKVQNALTKLQGVKKAEVNHKLGSAKVIINPQKVDAQILINTITSAGYRAVQKTQ